MSPERVMLWLLAGVTIASFATWFIQDSVFDATVTFSILSCVVALLWGATRYEKTMQLSGMRSGGILNILSFVAVTAGLTYWCIYFYDFPLVGSIVEALAPMPTFSGPLLCLNPASLQYKCAKGQMPPLCD